VKDGVKIKNGYVWRWPRILHIDWFGLVVQKGNMYTPFDEAIW